MKKLILGMGMLGMVLAVSCKKDVPPPPPPPPPAPAQPMVPPPPPPAPEKQDGTSVNVGSDGVDVQSSDGSRKTGVSVSGGKASVEVKK
jgi:hypothetical protein